MDIEMIADYQCEIGEGPLWHPLERQLYWVDIPAGRLFRYDPATNHHEQIWQGEPIGGFTIHADGALLLFGHNGSVRIWKQGRIETLVDEVPAERGGRFNDVIADPDGRVFCGTIPVSATADSPGHLGRLYRLDLDGTLTQVLDGIDVSNGLGFTPDGSGLYHTDSGHRCISLFDYDQATGGISNRRIFTMIAENTGVPDGLTVDAEGYVWSARWDGGCLVRYAPDGSEERRITFPMAKRISSVTFGGEEYRDMYVTTAGGNNRQKHGSGAGALFRLYPGVQGRPEFLSRIGVL